MCVCVMGKPSSKLRKNENNTDSRFYQIYLPKLHEKVLKYYRLDLSKEIAIGFKHSLQTITESPASLFKSLLV